jgi:hypothetical protein
MKSILKIMLKNRIITLIVINIAIIIWIVWYQGQIQYEPLLDFSNPKERIFPLHPEVYNPFIVIIVLNINDIHPENLSCFHHMTPKMKAKKLKQLPREIIFELGVYTKVDNLLKWCNEADLDDVDRQATAMIVASVPIRICK